MQLAVYRLAWHHLTGAPLDRIRASFHHVAAKRHGAPGGPARRAGLVALIRSVPFATGTDRSAALVGQYVGYAALRKSRGFDRSVSGYLLMPGCTGWLRP